jgi:hypothetical protein
VSVAAYVDGVDRVLTRAHGLFPSAAGDGGQAFSAGGGGSVPGVPAGESGLATGADIAGGVYTRAQTTVSGLDAESGEAVTEADAIGTQGFSGSGVIRDQARAQAAAIAPMSNSAAGMRLLVSTMDAHVTAMQQQVSTTNAQNQALSTRLRVVAQGYRGQGGMVDGPQPAGGQVRAVDFTQDGPQPPPGPQPFLPTYEQALTAPPAPPPSGPPLPFSPPQSPPTPPPPAWSPACQAAAEQQQQDLVKKILADMGKGAVLGGLAGVTVDGVGALPGLIAGAAIGGIGGVIDWATSPNPLPQRCK